MSEHKTHFALPLVLDMAWRVAPDQPAIRLKRIEIELETMFTPHSCSASRKPLRVKTKAGKIDELFRVSMNYRSA